MNKFYGISFLIHLIVILFIFKLSDYEEIKFVKKSTMIVSVKTNRGRSSSALKNLSGSKEIEKKVKKPKKVEKIKEVKEIKEVKKVEIPKKTKKIKKIKSKKNIRKEVKKIKKVEIKKESNEKAAYNEFQDKNRFIQGKDGIFTAISSKGIEYEILKEIDPKYPIIAKKMGYKGQGEVNTSFLVDINGNIKNIKIISGEEKFGFKNEVIKALKKWKFKPIVYKGRKIEVQFEKSFKFKK